MTFTYDVSTDLGKVRLLIVDSDAEDYLFADAEINVFLDLNDGDVRYAAAEAYETIARSRAKLAKVIQRDKLRTERHAIDDLLLCAEKIRNAALCGALQTGQISSDDQSYLDEYRPVWRGLFDVPVVE